LSVIGISITSVGMPASRVRGKRATASTCAAVRNLDGLEWGMVGRNSTVAVRECSEPSGRERGEPTWAACGRMDVVEVPAG
jgi:hypothetical protein